MLAENHGRIRGQQTALLALGKLGGREMTATSDLDLIIVYDFDAEHPQSDGARPLYGAQYFARLTQRLIGALSSQTNYGALYQVDMRLRPSGRSGPVATSIEAFASYQETEAWTWEHMALTRARVISGPPEFAARVEQTIRAVLCRKRDPAVIAADVVDMRQAIAQEKGEDARWDLKYAAGGLVDLEFIAQYLQLVHAADASGDPRHDHGARVRQGVAARSSVGRGCRRAAAGGPAVSQSDAGAAALPVRRRSIRRPRGQGFWGCFAAPPTCRTSRRSTRMSPIRGRRCARPSTGSLARPGNDCWL